MSTDSNGLTSIFDWMQTPAPRLHVIIHTCPQCGHHPKQEPAHVDAQPSRRSNR